MPSVTKLEFFFGGFENVAKNITFLFKVMCGMNWYFSLQDYISLFPTGYYLFTQFATILHR